MWAPPALAITDRCVTVTAVGIWTGCPIRNPGLWLLAPANSVAFPKVTPASVVVVVELVDVVVELLVVDDVELLVDVVELVVEEVELLVDVVELVVVVVEV